MRARGPRGVYHAGRPFRHAEAGRQLRSTVGLRNRVCGSAQLQRVLRDTLHPVCRGVTVCACAKGALEVLAAGNGRSGRPARARGLVRLPGLPTYDRRIPVPRRTPSHIPPALTHLALLGLLLLFFYAAPPALELLLTARAYRAIINVHLPVSLPFPVACILDRR